ncbi:MAG TPA: hypothetical protein VII56_06755 [Rhizomicrobium sp.]
MTQTTTPGAPSPTERPAPLPEEPAAPRSDDALRRLAAERLAEHLDLGASLIQRCEDLSLVRKGDRLGPIYAAARVLRADAQVAQALARVAQVESCHRSVVETVAKPDPKFVAWQQQQQTRKPSEIRAELAQRLAKIVETARAKVEAEDVKEMRAAAGKLDDPIYPPY